MGHSSQSLCSKPSSNPSLIALFHLAEDTCDPGMIMYTLLPLGMAVTGKDGSVRDTSTPGAERRSLAPWL
jgi:hypothetical protein